MGTELYDMAFRSGYEYGLSKQAGFGKFLNVFRPLKPLVTDTGRLGGRVLGSTGRLAMDTGRYVGDVGRFGGRVLGAAGRFAWKHPVIGTLGLGAGSYQVSKAMGNEDPWPLKKKRNPVVNYLDEAFVSGENASRNRTIAGSVAITALLAYLLSQSRRRY
jgi:hypothetical protein